MNSIREFIFSSLLTFDSFGLLSDHCKCAYKLQAEQYINSNGIFLKLLKKLRNNNVVRKIA